LIAYIILSIVTQYDANMNLIICALQLFLVCIVYAQDEHATPRGTPMKFKTPQLSDEEMHSNFMPELMECDACKAIAKKVGLSQLMGFITDYT